MTYSVALGDILLPDVQFMMENMVFTQS